ncbi:uncharacterized protein ColSpa_01707 [Colletotrichum spaethianum]|uniref:Uncharacterized protein n=1 Tax=Colletotrichum spaethianum TaxID=700344 RepID=A0AA37P4L7_9PEZI|nr:uncharacterized protein ColSpa_01707 [Colletotrichum spaethianum]GKT41526.1 hypothetical protein ColSpa_01707 [Colletotrichum spaethianum]
MKSATLMPALLAIVQAALIPNDPKIIIVPDSVLDATIDEPLKNFVPGPVAGTDPSSLPLPSLNEGFESLSSPEETSLSGAQAWAAIELEATAALESSPEDAERFVEARARDLSEVAKGPGGKKGKKGSGKKGDGKKGNTTSKPAPPDFHRGVTREQLCTYFRGIAWKTGDLQRPVYQWQYEYVPWLIQNKGPYIKLPSATYYGANPVIQYVLDGLRHIEWILWKIERSLQYTTNFTPEEERAIIRCYYQYSGYERQVTRLPTGAPAPVSPTTAAAIPASTGNAELAEAAMKPPGKGKGPGTGKSPVTTLPGSDRWARPFPSLKKLLRLITAKAPVSKYQSYANHRIHNVLQNLDRSAIGAAQGLINKFQSTAAKDYLVYDIEEGQGLKKALSEAINAYEVK